MRWIKLLHFEEKTWTKLKFKFKYFFIQSYIYLTPSKKKRNKISFVQKKFLKKT